MISDDHPITACLCVDTEGSHISSHCCLDLATRGSLPACNCRNKRRPRADSEYCQRNRSLERIFPETSNQNLAGGGQILATNIAAFKKLRIHCLDQPSCQQFLSISVRCHAEWTAPRNAPGLTPSPPPQYPAVQLRHLPCANSASPLPRKVGNEGYLTAYFRCIQTSFRSSLHDVAADFSEIGLINACYPRSSPGFMNSVVDSIAQLPMRALRRRARSFPATICCTRTMYTIPATFFAGSFWSSL
ncbi:hypothetical protein FA95DRAFT_610178 [Auriscalpium vulgare]|uniref:Uncharacterized protein n=1 Tax=Auriscalpium vulgare TaxID=40419 RepID=A0ACB8REY6_9AGAM|nr:hypothetical protein FA95DRAFT_610178 [Auriscalpium vulgare]